MGDGMVITFLLSYWKEILAVIVIGSAIWYVNNLRNIVIKQKVQIVELQTIHKEDQANITALKSYNDLVAQRSKEVQRVTTYIETLPPKTIEVLKSEEANKFNHCMFAYLTARKLLPECENQGKATGLPDTKQTGK